MEPSSKQVCTHIRQVKKADVTKFIAQAQIKQCVGRHECAMPVMCLECGVVACDKTDAKKELTCLVEHVNKVKHALALEMLTGQIRCNICEIPSVHSFLVGYTGGDEQITKLKFFNDFIVKCWTQRSNTKQPSAQQLKIMFGLVNLSNTCYLNSVLQCLYGSALKRVYLSLNITEGNKIKYEPIPKYVEYFYDEVLEKKEQGQWIVVSEKRVSNKDKNKPFRVTKVKDRSFNRHFQRFVKEAPNSGGVYNPEHLFTSLGMIEPRFSDRKVQNDAQQCLRILLDSLSQGELMFLDFNLDRYRKIEKCMGPQKLSIVDRLFGTYLASRVVCLKCQKVSWTVDLALDLQTEIAKSQPQKPKEQPNSKGVIDTKLLSYALQMSYPETLQTPPLLRHFFTQQQLTKSNFYQCDSCKSQIASKRFFLLQPGQILTIVIKRFKGLQKDSTFIPFPQSLDLSGISLKPTDSQYKHRTKYTLSGVIIHEGGSSGHGHYISCVKYGECWVMFNDAKVLPTSWDRVSKLQAYILFYRADEQK